jgi:hypothetical protein
LIARVRDALALCAGAHGALRRGRVVHGAPDVIAITASAAEEI